MLKEDGNPPLTWFKKTSRDDDKYMSNLVKCEQVILLSVCVHTRTHMYITLTHANTLFICTCRFLFL